MSPRGAAGLLGQRDASVEDGVLAAGLAVLAFAPALSKVGAQIGDLPGRPADVASVALALAQALPLAVRRRFPAAVLAVVGAAFAADQALGYPTTFASLGLYLALYSAGAHQDRRRRTVAAAATVGYAVLALVLHHLGAPHGIGDYSVFYLVTTVAWLAGSVMRRLRQQEIERRRLVAEAAGAAERARIARELHDVVTHHVTAMVVQADAAQFLLSSNPERVVAGLTSVSDTGRRALTELRYLLGVLEATGDKVHSTGDTERPTSDTVGQTGDTVCPDRAPTQGAIADLVEQARATGQPVEFREIGDHRPRPAAVELAAYRVVQEALTNAMKYATAARTNVSVHQHPQHMEVEVTTEGPAKQGAAASASPPRAPQLPAGGRGLAGLRERVRVLHGELEAGPRSDGGFVVRARIPFGPDQE
ncbi:sensor histidine kinase [Catenulispora sp. GP43]|uniref:sensor histidine kinase n=1 Tax=Catenulispora sp. GP43 TaxID=3156263 RepID=UPI003510DCFF